MRLILKFDCSLAKFSEVKLLIKGDKGDSLLLNKVLSNEVRTALFCYLVFQVDTGCIAFLRGAD